MKNNKAHLFIAILFSFLYFLSYAEQAKASVIVRPPNNLGLVGYWSFDEGRGTQASDLSGNGNDGELHGAPEWVSGKSQRALEFGGVGNYVNVPSSSTLSFSESELTISAWFRFPETFGNEQALIRKDGQYQLGFSNSGTIRNLVGTSGTTGWTASNDINYAFSSNTWYLLTVVYNGSTITTYVNSVEVGSAVVTGTISTNGNYIGIAGNLRPFIGAIDDVRIYSRALSASEIQSLYSNTKSTIVGEVSAGHYSDGLVAHYTFDGSTLSGATVSDAVGASDGTLTAGPIPTLGKLGQGMLFNGSTGGINLGTPSALQITGDQTIAMWVYPTAFSARRNPFAKAYGGEGTITQETSGTLNYYYGTNGGNSTPYQGFNSGTPVVLNTWNHITLVRDLSANPMRLRWYINGIETATTNANYAAATAGTNPAYIGQGYVSRYAGVIDDVRLYNRALSAEEVKGLAGSAVGEVNSSTNNLLTDGLAGFWTFDTETMSGSTISDLSGNEKDGTIVGTTPSIASGRIGDALEFTGTTGYINFLAPLSSPDDWTYSFWFYPTGAPDIDWAGLAGQGNNPRVTHHTDLTVSTGAVYQAGGWAGGTSTGSQLSLNTWHQITAVWHDGSSATPTHELYVNGMLVGSRTYSGAIILPSGVHHVNRRDSNSTLEGRVDDMRIYNRALSASEAMQLYQMGN